MAHADDYAASLDPRVQDQVTAAIQAYCETVQAEGTGVTGHTTRYALATKIADGQAPGGMQALILSACCFASLTSTSTDTVVNNAVAACWNLWAGA